MDPSWVIFSDQPKGPNGFTGTPLATCLTEAARLESLAEEPKLLCSIGWGGDIFGLLNTYGNIWKYMEIYGKARLLRFYIVL
jgi:hypothetical protein